MPTNTPILKINIDDTAFRNFKTQYDDYVKSVKAQPGAWKMVSEEQGTAFTRYEKMLRAIGQMPPAQQGLVEGMKEHEKLLTHSERLWTSVTHSSKEFAGHIKGATESLLRWTGILGLVGGVFDALSIWGIARMAGQVHTERAAASGLGISIGQQKAFGSSYNGIFGDPNAYLNWIQGMETDVTNRKPFWALMHGDATGNTMNDSLALMDAIRSKLLTTDKNLWGQVIGKGMGVNMSSQEMQSLASMGETEYGDLRKNFYKTAKELDIGDPVAKKWDDFNRVMSDAGDKIHKVFVEGLVKLQPALIDFVEGFGKFVAAIMQSGVVQDALTKLSTWMTNTAKTFNSQDFEDSVTHFMSSVGEMAQVINNVLHPYDALKRDIPDMLDEFILGGINKKLRLQDVSVHNLASAERYGEANGLPKGLMFAEEWVESGGMPGKVNPVSGAQGYMQILPATVAALNKQYGQHWDPQNLADSLEMAKIINQQNIKKYSKPGMSQEEILQDVLGAYLWGAGTPDDPRLDALLTKLDSNAKNWPYFVEPGLKSTINQEMRIILSLQQNPGSDLAIAINQIVGSGMGHYQGANEAGW